MYIFFIFLYNYYLLFNDTSFNKLSKAQFLPEKQIHFSVVVYKYNSISLTFDRVNKENNAKRRKRYI